MAVSFMVEMARILVKAYIMHYYGAIIILKISRNLLMFLILQVLYAPALNYVYPYYERHTSQLPTSIKDRLDAGFVHNLSHTS